MGPPVRNRVVRRYGRLSLADAVAIARLAVASLAGLCVALWRLSESAVAWILRTPGRVGGGL